MFQIFITAVFKNVIEAFLEASNFHGALHKLEALLEEPDDREPVEAVLLCHPHPQHGGTMHNKVVYRMARGLRHSGSVVLRFNYRGVNLSQGKYDHGVGETEDARAALAFLRTRYPTLPYSLAGFSFGSRIALQLGCELGSPARLIMAGFPTRYHEVPGLGHCPIPRVFIHSTHDEFGAVPDLERFLETLPDPKRLVLVEAADHFFGGALDQFEAAIQGANV